MRHGRRRDLTREHFERHAIAQAVNRRPLTAKVRVHFRASGCGICSGQSGTDTRSFSFIHLPSTLCNTILAVGSVVSKR